MTKSAEDLLHEPANVYRMPVHAGSDCYFGGNYILAIGDRAIDLGVDAGAKGLAEELARRWNNSLPESDA